MPARVQISRKRGYKLRPDTVKVARPSRFGSPWLINLDDGLFYRVDKAKTENFGKDLRREGLTRSEAVTACRGYLLDRLKHEPDFLEPLRGKDLGCFCRLNEPCHADVLLELANGEPVTDSEIE